MKMNLYESQSLLAIFAHPDDESLVSGGTIAYHVSLGWQAGLICATRGEWGPINDQRLANRENLGEVRERELLAACEVLGITWLRFLDLEDGCVANVLGTIEEELTLEKIVRAIRERRPQLVITFGRDGLYGHEDHIAIGQLATRACAMAGDPNVFPHQLSQNLTAHCVSELYYATVPLGLYPDLISRLARSGHETNFWGLPSEHFGVSPEEITITVDITPFLDHKLAALRCHRTQLNGSNFFTHLTRNLAMRFFNREYFQQATDEMLHHKSRGGSKDRSGRTTSTR
jgi:LmbE family N-acetylglucosaminyl deacetylase